MRVSWVGGLGRGLDRCPGLTPHPPQSPVRRCSARGRSRAWWTRRAARTACCAGRLPAQSPQGLARSSAATTTSPTCRPATCARPPASWAAPSACAIPAAAQVLGPDGREPPPSAPSCTHTRPFLSLPSRRHPGTHGSRVRGGELRVSRPQTHILFIATAVSWTLHVGGHSWREGLGPRLVGGGFPGRSWPWRPRYS